MFIAVGVCILISNSFNVSAYISYDAYPKEKNIWAEIIVTPVNRRSFVKCCGIRQDLTKIICHPKCFKIFWWHSCLAWKGQVTAFTAVMLRTARWRRKSSAIHLAKGVRHRSKLRLWHRWLMSNTHRHTDRNWAVRENSADECSWRSPLRFCNNDASKAAQYKGWPWLLRKNESYEVTSLSHVVYRSLPALPFRMSLVPIINTTPPFKFLYRDDMWLSTFCTFRNSALMVCSPTHMSQVYCILLLAGPVWEKRWCNTVMTTFLRKKSPMKVTVHVCSWTTDNTKQEHWTNERCF